MANDLILVCAEAARNPAWGLFLVSRVGPEGVILENVAGLTPDTITGLTFLRSPLGPLPVGKLLRESRATRAPRTRRAADCGQRHGGRDRYVQQRRHQQRPPQP